MPKKFKQPPPKPLTAEQIKTWLGKAVAVPTRNEWVRPALTWAVKTEFNGRPAMVATDQYRVHVDWQYVDDFPDKIEFPKSEETDLAYPCLDAICPRNTSSVAMYVQDLINAVKRAKVFAREESLNCPTKFTYKNNQFDVFAKSSERGDVTTHLDCFGGGESLTISLNGNFVLDALQGFRQEDRVVLRYVGGSNPCYFTNEGEQTRLALLMPLSTNR